MLNAANLSELLANNVDEKLYPRMFAMSPNGTLLAYSTPVDIKELRDQATLVAMSWKDNETILKSKRAQEQPSEDTSPVGLETLTIEFDANNILVRAVQPALLLVLVGGVPPNRKKDFKFTAEAHGDPRYPPAPGDTQGLPANLTTDGNSSGDGSPRAESDKDKAASVASQLSQKEKDIKAGVLHIHRKKLDAMTEYIRKDFESKGFTMPDDSTFA
ncbi:hypothetical protein EJ04DRAFT_511488 [Polyplosphaeria fusca]|uniref:Uncharacterized protein n=1 Tax=Polyplosphaeria fusca TaxID=682080 RepID=A0A9P4V513_9PLEO|nr:hypothetical protein EJ04DRAFT_511488 [Polyplosphaeria fusca]